MGNTLPLAVGTLDLVWEGITQGIITVGWLVAVTSTMPDEMVAPAMTMYMLFRNIGYTVGVALASSISQSILKDLLTDRIQGPDAAEIAEFIRTSIRKVDTLSPDIQQIVAESLSTALQKASLLIIVCLICTAALAFSLKNVNLKGPS
ncbi:hypothetical protein BDB00DRAFT_876765 [Zychaea mexicana]|uniref:uncharacterized protein n=1 Tax=Zychaea mexicana TaxID=64656 RepID=UPI0022FF0086|nr:uncharacterized protein BDB00DRAFT_876765 [Zychaea mexicana]KAI9489096.1 hypothetical protein BDB00DRAFT_876765 [Zychaea mexicana]